MDKEKGTVLVLAMFVMMMILFLAGIFLQLTLINIKLLTADAQREKAKWIAKAGLSQAYYNLKSNYFLYEQNVLEKDGSIEIPFAGGKYKVGTATLIGQGFHRSIIVSIGEYEENKIVLVSEIEMNTLTDYLYFRETGEQGVYLAEDSYYFGPVHVNGNVNIGFLAVTRGNEIAFVKSKDDYGPVLRASGKVLFRGGGDNTTVPFPLGYYCRPGTVLFGEGTIPLLWRFSYNDWPTIFYAAKNGIDIWPAPKSPLSYGGGSWNWAWWDYAYDGAKPYDKQAYPTTVIKTTSDGQEYKYDLVQDSSGGANYIKMPRTTGISYNKFRHLITDEWYFKKGETPKHGKVVKIINDVLHSGLEFYSIPNGGWVGKQGYGYPKTSLGPVFFNRSDGFDVKIPSDIDIDYVKNVFLISSEQAQLSAGASMPVGDWQFPMTSYTIDKGSRLIKFQYPIEWAKGVFKSGPVGGKWRRWFAMGDGKVPDVVPNNWTTTLDIMLEGGHGWPTQSSLPVADGTEEIYINGEKWTRVSALTDSGLEAAGYITPEEKASAKVYQINYTTGVVTFGNGILGAKPPGGAYISRIWARDESSSFEVRLGETVEVVKLNLSEITPENAPRDPRDPNNPNKYGIIFSEMPVVVYGIPRAPVTIVCMEDIYVGPINAPYLRTTTGGSNGSYDIYDPFLGQDSPDACPVGLISAKIMYLDETYAPVVTSGKKSWANAYGESGIRKVITLNKVALFHSIVRDYLRGSEFHYIYSPNYANQMGLLSVNGIMSKGSGHREWQDPTLLNDPFWKNYVDSYSPTANGIRFIGSIYNDVNYNIIKWVNNNATGAGGAGGQKRIWCHWVAGDTYGYDDQIGARVYASSFRSWDRANPDKSGAPPNMPKEIKILSINLGDVNISENFINELKSLLEKNEKYTDEFGQALLKLQESLYQ